MSSVEQKISEVLIQLQSGTILHAPYKTKELRDQATQALLQIIGSDVIGEDETDDAMES